MGRATEAHAARSQTEVLKMIGDIGCADVKPPENVFFVCKLNTVMESGDLKTFIVFMRVSRGKCARP
jgi:peptidyl-prolyl cis-trans isomerase-like 4